MKSLFLACLMTLFLGGCASIDSRILTAGTTGHIRFNPEDVDAAIVIAQTNKDKMAEQCFQAIKKHLDVTPEPIIKGPVSAYAAGRSVRRALSAPLNEEVHTACAPLIVDSATFASKFLVPLIH